MKTYKSIALTVTVLFTALLASAQTADEIIAKYLQTMGGKEQIKKVNSLYTEGTMDVMGNSGVLKITTLNGKGFKSEIEVMGSVITSCFNVTGGWTINPMTGSSTAESMPEAQYKAGKDQIFIGAPFIFYAEKGYKTELLGAEAVGDLNTWKIKITSPENEVVTYFFDQTTGNLVRQIRQVEMQGSMVDNTMTFSDYQQTDGFPQPHKIAINVGGQFEMTMNINKIEVNKPVDEAIFAKP
jgi:hypothetical protein